MVPVMAWSNSSKNAKRLCARYFVKTKDRALKAIPVSPEMLCL